MIPKKNSISYIFKATNTSDYVVTIVSNKGQILYNNSFKNTCSVEGNYTVNPGIYSVSVTNGGAIVTKQVVVQ